MLYGEQILPLSAQLLVSESAVEELIDFNHNPNDNHKMLWASKWTLIYINPSAFLQPFSPQKEFEDLVTHFSWHLSDHVYLSALSPSTFLVFIAILWTQRFSAICGSKLTEKITFLPCQIPTVPRVSLTPGLQARNNEKKQDFTAWRTEGNYPSTNNTFLQDFPAWADCNYTTSMENTVAA